MSSEPTFIIRGRTYAIPQNERLGELRLIERVTGLTNRDFRTRALDQQQRIAELDENDDANLTVREVLELLDDIVTVGRVAQAIQRANPTWSTEKVARFVDGLADDEVAMEGADADEDDEDDDVPPTNGEPDRPSSSPSGIGPAPPSSSGSESASSESENPPTSGTPTSATSVEERSNQAT